MAPPPGAVLVPGDGFVSGNQGWRWTRARLEGGATLTVAATVRLPNLPAGEALLVQAEVQAARLPLPLRTTGGALVEDRSRGAGIVQFTPGQAATLQSDEGRVEIAIPAAAARQGLILQHGRHAPAATATPGPASPTVAVTAARAAAVATTDTGSTAQAVTGTPATTAPSVITTATSSATAAPPAQRAATPGPARPPLSTKELPIPGRTRGYQPFFLQANDDQGREVTQFDAPLTLRVRYTQEQLAALGIHEGDLTIFWFDEQAENTLFDGTVVRGRWVSLPTTIDPATSTATTQIDHFSSFSFGDGSSPSEAYLPSVQGWQVDAFTGSASFSYPIEVPAGPGGIKPSLALSYNSASTDSKGGMRAKGQSSWVGKGWSLDPGSVAFNKIDQQNPYYSLAANGISATLVRGAARVANPNLYYPDQWYWHATNEEYLRVEAVYVGASFTGSPGRGGFNNPGQPYPRYLWRAWSKDGTRYEFAEDLWWGWSDCVSNIFEPYKWRLSRVIDTHGNVITYNYGRQTYWQASTTLCSRNVSGTIDQDSWLTTIDWGGDLTTGANPRFRVLFTSSNRANDLTWEAGGSQLPNSLNGSPRETKLLEVIEVQSNAGGGFQRIRQYNLGYSYGLLSDNSVPHGQPGCNTGAGTYCANTGTPRLTLVSIQRRGSNGTTVLPTLTLSYGTTRGSGFLPNGDWNRLTVANNSQGGTVTFNYQPTFTGGVNERNYRRVTSKVVADGRGNSTTWSYAYTNPLMNMINSSASIYYNTYRYSPFGTNNGLLAYPAYSEFRGHSWTREQVTDSQTGLIGWTERYFYQGDAGCTPTGTGGWLDNPPAGSCFANLRLAEFLRGKEWKTQQKSAGGALLRETEHVFVVDFLSYGNYPLAGLWRGWTRETQTLERFYQGGGSSVTKRTDFEFNPALQGGVQSGLVTKTLEYDYTGALYRTTERVYNRKDDSQGYIVDRVWGQAIKDGLGRYLSDTNYLYDGLAGAGLGTTGDLTRVHSSVVPLVTNINTNSAYSGRDTTYGYDAYGNRTQETTYTGWSWRYIDSAYAVAWSPPGGGSAARTTTTTYDSTYHALPTQVSQPTVNGVTITQQAGYDWQMLLLTQITDQNGNQSSAQYDVFGRMLKLIKTGDSVAAPTVEFGYYDWDQPVKVAVHQYEWGAANASFRPTARFYDGLGRLIQTKVETLDPGAQSAVTDTKYDGLGRVWRQSQPRYTSNATPTIFWTYTPLGTDAVERWTTTAFDGLGRQTGVTAPDGTTTTTGYWNGGPYATIAGTIDAKGHRTDRGYDIFGRLIVVTEVSGNGGSEGGYAAYATTNYAYNPLDLLTQVSDAAGNVTTMSYNSLGRKTAMADPDMGNWSYQYDQNGNLTSQTDAKGQTLTFGYDALNRLTSKGYPGGAQALYQYDEAVSTNGRGQRTSTVATDGTTIRWQYDGRGRVTEQKYWLPALNAFRSFTWTYDSADRVKTLTYPNSEVVTTTYDAGWRPATLCTSLGGCYVSSASYTALNQPLQTTLGNGRSESRQYDTMARLWTLDVWGAGLNRGYVYDTVGNVTQIQDFALSQTQFFTYDHRDRLDHAWTTGSATGAYDQVYSYSQIGNLTSKAGVTYTYPAAGQPRPHTPTNVGGQTMSYDANGNLSSGMGRTYSWNADNLPTAITAPTGNESYSYDADGERVWRNYSGITTYLMGGLYEEDAPTGKTRSHYLIAGRTIAQREVVNGTHTLLYLHGDHLGSVSVVTAASGAVISNQNYTPWGELRSGGVSQTTLNFTGQKKDGTGLLYYHARMYDPALGKFITADSIVPGTASGAGGAAATIGYDGSTALAPLTVDFHEPGFVVGLGDELRGFVEGGFFSRGQKPRTGPINPQALNRYAYVLNNPVRYTDPTGHGICDGRAVEVGCGGVVENKSSKPIKVLGAVRVSRDECQAKGDSSRACRENEATGEWFLESFVITIDPGKSSLDYDVADVDFIVRGEDDEYYHTEKINQDVIAVISDNGTDYRSKNGLPAQAHQAASSAYCLWNQISSGFSCGKIEKRKYEPWKPFHLPPNEST